MSLFCRMCWRLGFLSFWLVAAAASKVWAGGSGLNVVVVVNQNSSNSLQLANDYCEQRGVPPQNVLLLNHVWSGGQVSCWLDEFQTNLLSPLLEMLQTNGLTNQIEYVVLSMDLPYSIADTNGWNSTTSALFYGYKPDTAPPSGLPNSCSLPDDSSNSYAFSELAFADAPPNTAETNAFLAVMLTDTNLAYAESTLARAVASDSTAPGQEVYLEKTDDTARNVRFYEFNDAIFEVQVLGDYSITSTNSNTTTFTNLFGLETGLASFTESDDGFVPGAIADNLTSYGGQILQPNGQTPLLAFLHAGASISYGTVIEPCNYTQKFPDPLDYFYQRRGFSLAEAYYQSVLNPYQGLMVGEPLAAPFAQRGTGVWPEFSPGTIPVLSGQTNLSVVFDAATTNLPLGQVDLFIDGTWFETVTNIPPAPGNALSVTLNGIVNTYMVPSNATLATVSGGLASVLNTASNQTLVSASAFGDRILLRSSNPNPTGVQTGFGASSNPKSAPVTFLTQARPGFLDSTATGFHNVVVSNTPSVGDWIQLQIIETNGNGLSYAVTNTASGTTIGQFMQALYTVLQNAVPLQATGGLYPGDFDDETPAGYADFNLYARSSGWPASAIQVTLTASPDLAIPFPATNLLQDNLSDLQPRNQLYLASGLPSLTANWTLDTTQLPDGYHQLTAVAYEGTSVRTQTQVSQNVLIQNTAVTATLNTLYGGSNTDVNETVQFSVTVNRNSATIQLFSTGGLLGTVSGQTNALFSVAGTNLGVGLHPFYAIVTLASGRQYRTATTWIRFIGPEPPITLTLASAPLTLHWTATVGRSYAVLSSTNLSGPFVTNAIITPTNSAAQWLDTNNSAAATFFLVKTMN